MTYDAAFYKIEEDTAVASAAIVLPHVLKITAARSVIDVGCGTGAWAAEAYHAGCLVRGVDDYAGPVLVEQDDYVRADISRGVPCDGFDLAICLEVGEHLPERSARRLVAGLCEARYVLFSAAIPGQGGVNHVNERWGSWWAQLFAEHRYVGSSDLRWMFWDDHRIANWYRQNVLVFARPERLTGVGLRVGVVDVVHPDRMGNWP